MMPLVVFVGRVGSDNGQLIRDLDTGTYAAW
jgi:hypothetical protein